MDVVGSEIGQKMRSAIKAKLTELGCYVDDELPDYVMVMVANKRTRSQMEDDLQLFLGDNTEQFVNWLHQVLEKLQEVTITAPKATESTDKGEVRPKQHKVKEKKVKTKTKKSETPKKSKKKSKEHKKKSDKKSQKSKKKKGKQSEMIRPNVPPLLMNMEKESEPSITDVFAGQILKNHGITIDNPHEVTKETKPMLTELKRPQPIIDPETISTESNVEEVTVRESQIQEINDIEEKIEGLKQKLVGQLDNMSDDEDFLTIRTEAEELMTDFAEDVLQEISAAESPTVCSTPPLAPKTSCVAPQTSRVVPQPPKTSHVVPQTPSEAEPKTPPKPIEPETLPQIELNLPKRPIRERLGVKETTDDSQKSADAKKEKERKRRDSPERFTPEREPDFWPRSAKQRASPVRLPPAADRKRARSASPEEEPGSKRLGSSSSGRRAPASVVRVRPRPRGLAPRASLLLRAVADAQRSLINIPPKQEHQQGSVVKRALVRPMRRATEAKNIVIQVSQPAARPDAEDLDSEAIVELDSDGDGKKPKPNKDVEYVPRPITKQIVNTDYVPSRRPGDAVDETIIVETINTHKTNAPPERGPRFVVTLDGLDPNMFLAKKLKSEGIIDDESELRPKPKAPSQAAAEADKVASVDRKRLSNTSDESDTQVIINEAKDPEVVTQCESVLVVENKRKASPIVFDVKDRSRAAELAEVQDKEPLRERTESTGSDHVVITTATARSKYDALPPLPAAPRRAPCRQFPACRFGAACAFAHPPCRYRAACARRGCAYDHPAAARPGPLASAVSAARACRYGLACADRARCLFYHGDA